MSALTLESVLACPALPSLPSVAIDVLELTRDESVKLQQIAEVVQKDQGLTAKILKTVNSSYYGLDKPCPTISRALAYLGLNSVKSLVLSFSLVDLTKEEDTGFDLADYWKRSLYAAAAARRISDRAGGIDPEETFIAALMQDVGMLAFHTADAKAYAAVVEESNGDHRNLPKLERAAFGFDHAEVGAQLGVRWRLPEQLVEGIRHHHDGKAEHHPNLVHCVVLGFEAAAMICYEESAGARKRLEQHAHDWFGFTLDDVQEIMRLVDEDARELGRLFKVSTGNAPDVNRILAEAEEASVQHQLATQREQENLRRANSELTKQATTDGLTNVGNRKRFDDELATRFDQASSFKGSLGLILVDADHFKSFNDTYGHQAGDAVLIELAGRLGESVRGLDLVCRYGGEEFAVILPGAGLKHVATIAERLRRSIADRAFTFEGVPGVDEPLPVTVSLGAAVFDAETSQILSSPGLLVKAADKALYAAKHAGRNCVRVFRLRREAAA